MSEFFQKNNEKGIFGYLKLSFITRFGFSGSWYSKFIEFHSVWEKNCLYFVGFIGKGIGFEKKVELVWYCLFIIFVLYAMLPLPLRWCMIAGFLSALGHLIIVTIEMFAAADECVMYLQLLLPCNI